MAMPHLSDPDHTARPVSAAYRHDDPQAALSAVSWRAILAGATGSAALSLILLILGTGIGLSSVSPWAHAGVSAKTFGITTVVWLTVTQLIASGVGGYLAGRLRTKWVATHTDEVYFRDTAHGFLSWAVASLATAALLTSAIASIVDTGIQVGVSTSDSAVGTVAAQVHGDASSDATERRANDATRRATAPLREMQAPSKEEVDSARRASTYAALWLFASLLIGAFASSLAATWGGRRRDA